MKRSFITLFMLLATLVVSAQTLNVQVGSTIDQYTASSTGEMTYSSGTALTILNKSYNISDITKMYTDESTVTNNEVKVVYSGTTALVYVAGNVAQYVTPTISGAYVTIAQTNTEAVDDDEITYVLSGSATDGQFALSGSYKCTLSLAGVDLTCTTGAAINITNSKRIQISAKEGYTNTLTDCASGSQKACIYSKGQLQLQGKGTLNVVGNTKHGIKSASYISIKNLTLNVTSAVGDAINCEEYFQMKSGTVTLSGMSDDGIQCDLGGDSSTGETTDHEDEDSGNIYIEGGTLTVTVTAEAAKGIKADGDMVISDGTINVTNSGKYAYDSDDAEYKSSIGLKTDGNMTINGGTITLKATGYAGKCIRCDSILTINDGTITATATGSSSDTYGAAKAIKAGTATSTSSATNRAPGGGNWGGGGTPGGGNTPGGGTSGNYTYSGGMVITGGTIIAKASSHEAIESKSTLDISGGYVYAESSDDAINSSSHMTITGGYVMGNSTGNDGLDANGNMYIKGGTVFAIATSQPEVGLDANTEGGYQLYITGGNVIAIGGLENGASVSTSKSSTSYSKGSWYAFKSGGTTQFSFKVPSNSSMGSSMVICSSSTPSVSKLSSTPSGTTIWNGYGVIN